MGQDKRRDALASDSKLRRLLEFAERESLSLEACWVLKTLAICYPMQRERLVSNSLGFAEPGVFTSDAIARAVPSLIASGYIEQAHQESLERIRSFLASDTALGPVFELPSEEQFDMTLEGAEFYWKLLREVHGITPENYEVTALRRVRSGRLQVFGTHRASVAEFFFDEVYRQYDHVVAGPLREIGPWRCNWWELIPRGWRICAQVKGRNPKPAGDPGS